MAMSHRVGFTAGQSAELWERWKKGEGLKSIGRACGKPSSCIFARLRPSGGIMPPARRRSRLALTMAEREEISRGIVEGQSVRAIARMLARAASTVSREISRNGGAGRYRAAAADKLAWKQALRPKPCKLAVHGQLRQAVVRKLGLNWSPEQIAGWLKRAYPETEAWRVSHETIYRSLYVQARGAEERADGASAVPTANPALAARNGEGRSAWPHPGCCLDQRATGVGRGSGRAGPLGGRPALWIEQQLHRHIGRTPLALCDARQGPQQGNANRG